MFVDFHSAYFVLTIPFIVIWALLFIFSKNTRREQLLMSLLISPLGTISEFVFYFKDYWIPESILSFSIGPASILLEDFLFAFCIGGIGGVIYEVFFYKKISKLKRPIHKILELPAIVTISGLAAYLLFLFGVNSIFATSAGFVICALLIISQRRDLLLNSLLSGVAVMSVMFFSYIILYNSILNVEELARQGWLLYGTSLDIRIFNIPATEMVWGFAWGMVAGPMYEFWKGIRLIGE